MPYPPGHFYSPLPDPDEIRRRRATIFDRSDPVVPGVEMNLERQKELLEEFRGFYADLPFPAEREPGCRYWYRNDQYSYADAIFLFCMLRHARPRRVIEIGSGFSSAATLDTIERFLGDDVRCTFVEPFPERLLALVREGDLARHELRRQPVQDTPLELFDELAENDVLFVDSTHVAKTGSDVNHLVFRVLPRLAKGVLVHFHDVHWPFEYPEPWVLEGRGWNEAYLLHAFLMHNDAWEIVCFNTFLESFLEEWFHREMPLCLRNPGGSLWLRSSPGGE